MRDLIELLKKSFLLHCMEKLRSKFGEDWSINLVNRRWMDRHCPVSEVI